MLGLSTRDALRLVVVIVGASVALVSWVLGQSMNYEVFVGAAHAFIDGTPLYPGVGSWFKYSPSFALGFTPFALMPPWLGAMVWGALNFGVAFEGLARALEDDSDRAESRARLPIAVALAAMGVLITTDGDQSNLLVAGLVLLAYAGYRRGDTFVPAAFLIIGAYVKVFPLAFTVLALQSRDRRRAIAALAFWAVVIGLAPMIWMGPHAWQAGFQGWAAMMRADYQMVADGTFVPWTVGSMLRFGFALPIRCESAELAGAIVAFAPFALATLSRRLRARTDDTFTATLVASLLTFVVLFNHRSEYCSFTIAALAIAFWKARTSPERIDASFVALYAVTFFALGPVPTGRAATTVFDWLIVKRAFHPLRIPGLLVLWLLMQRDLWRVLFPTQPAPRLSRP